MLLPIQWPVASNRLVFGLYDYDSAGSDELVASMIFSIKEIVKEPGAKFKWLNLFGAPLDCSGDNTKRMNNNPELASTWKGRLLVQFYSEDTKHPEMKIQPITPELKQSAASWVQQNEFEIAAEIGAGICLPDSNKYRIKIVINDFTLETSKPLESKENYCRWSHRFDPQTFTTVYSSIEELDRVYIYLIDGDSPVCFWKGSCKDFVDPEPTL